MQLYEITENLKQLGQMIEDGVDESQLIDALNDVNEAFEEKAKSILFLIRNIEGNIELSKIEESRLANRRKSMEKQLDSIKSYLVMNMAESGKNKIDNGVIKASYIKPKPVLVLSDESIVPDSYKQPKVTVSIDKKLLLSDLKDGKEVEGASIGESKAGLSIK
jgi:hypothetical protein